MMSYHTQKILLTGNIDDESHAYLLESCEQSNRLYNCTLFLIRQAHFETCTLRHWFDEHDNYRMAYSLKRVKASYPQLCKELKANPHYQAIGGQQGQQTIKSVVEAINSYNKLLPLWFEGKLKDRPKIPKYRKKGGLYQVTFTSQNIHYEPLEGVCYLPISNALRPELEVRSIAIPSGVGFVAEQIAEVRIVPSNSQLWAEYVYEVQDVEASHLDDSQAISIDPGVSNWVTAVSTLGKSFIINGRKIKSINQRYNRFVAKYKQRKSDFYWDEVLAKVTHKRNCQMRDAVNKAARFLVNYCLTHGIGNIVFGWNEGNKQEVNLGKSNNQNFVQIPTARLKERVKQLAESVGIVFTETEEAYTSQASFLDQDLVPKYGEKPKEYKFSGKRVKRGLYQASNGQLVNSDCNGSANILLKVAAQLGLNLAKVVREILTVPKRYELSSLKRSYRKRAEMGLQPVECPSA